LDGSWYVFVGVKSAIMPTEKGMVIFLRDLRETFVG
jgi:hypothetical protein